MIAIENAPDRLVKRNLSRGSLIGLLLLCVFPPKPVAGQTPSINMYGVVDGASFRGSAGGGSIVSLFGSGLASSTVAATTLPLPVTLGGTTVTINGRALPLLYVSQNQINFQYPWELCCPDEVDVLTVTVNSVSSKNMDFTGAAFGSGPALFSMNSSGNGQGAVQIANTTILAAPTASIPGAQSRPARRGEYLTIYCTNLGPVNSSPAAGNAAPADPLATTTNAPSVTIGGISAPASFSGLTPGTVGLYQVNVQVPESVPSGNTIPLVLTIFGIRSVNTVTIAVE